MQAGIMPICSNYWEFKRVCPDNWGCGLCQCKDVELTFEPGGDFFQLGWYEVEWPATKRWRFGNAIHVKWNVRGDPRFCRYYQDEGRTEVKWQVVSPSVFPEKTAKGVDCQTVPQIYTDYLGFDIPPLGVTMTFAGKINITFRCVDSEPFSATKTRTIMKTVPPINVRSDEVPRHPLEDMVIK